jgi:hypothetical protein
MYKLSLTFGNPYEEIIFRNIRIKMKEIVNEVLFK